MNLYKATGTIRRFVFRLSRFVISIVPGGPIAAFGSGNNQIGSILVINLDRQPKRWHRVLRELKRFQLSDGAPLNSIVRRIAAVDARDGRMVAASADVDPNYVIGDQLFVQPDVRLEACFKHDEPVRMTRQEVAVARSHIEVWKKVASGLDGFVLVLEDDVWFKRGAAKSIDSGWKAALQRFRFECGPKFLYLSYSDAEGTAEKADICDNLFKPIRGMWFLSGYVISKEGAAILLRSMPVVGPVDTWINYRFNELSALALSSPAIEQRNDSGSDNSYSVLPFLARAGIVDTVASSLPSTQKHHGPIIVWTASCERESLAMALSMLGLRLRVFDVDENTVDFKDFIKSFEIFDVLVNPQLAPGLLTLLLSRSDTKFIIEEDAPILKELKGESFPLSNTLVISRENSKIEPWVALCKLLSLSIPIDSFPIGAHRDERLFRNDRQILESEIFLVEQQKNWRLDDTPWVLPQKSGWRARPISNFVSFKGNLIFHESMNAQSPRFSELVETFPGNLANFEREGVTYGPDGTHLVVKEKYSMDKNYSSGAIASNELFGYGRFEIEIQAASGSGLVTGFFLHRSAPRQEIDIEITGDDPHYMLINVYFNPGDEGSEMNFGYRGAPYRIHLGFDASLDFHQYAIEWRPGYIAWIVDGQIVHERLGWDPTPVPHLPMRLHANLWTPRSEELAGKINNKLNPTRSTFRNCRVWNSYCLAHMKMEK